MITDQKKIEKVNNAIEIFIKHDLEFYEHANGHFEIDCVNFYATTGTWYNPRTGEGGKGINSFLKYLKVN